MDDLKQAAIDAGIGNFRQTYLARGGDPAAFALPREFEVLLRHAPDAFAGYGMLRAGVMRDTDQGGALDLRTKELLFTVLDVAGGGGDTALAIAAWCRRRGVAARIVVLDFSPHAATYARRACA
ncbi:MAG: hypothetical protein ACO3EK_05070, partial [Alphaproteobacteria bacterium]